MSNHIFTLLETSLAQYVHVWQICHSRKIYNAKDHYQSLLCIAYSTYHQVYERTE